MMELIPCGTRVIPKLLCRECIVTAISIRYSQAAYELTYFNEGKQETVWMNEAEFAVKGEDKIIVGFAK